MTNYNKYNARPRCFEPNDEPSITIPDDAISLAEIVDNIQRGLPTGLTSSLGVFDDDDDNDFDTIDMQQDAFDALQMLSESDNDDKSDNVESDNGGSDTPPDDAAAAVSSP